MIDQKERFRQQILNGAWILFQRYIMDTEINSDEDRQCFLAECIDTSKYFQDNAPKMLNMLMFPSISDSMKVIKKDEPNKEGSSRNPAKAKRGAKRKRGIS